jgi:hypothetical protein
MFLYLLKKCWKTLPNRAQLTVDTNPTKASKTEKKTNTTGD